VTQRAALLLAFLLPSLAYAVPLPQPRPDGLTERPASAEDAREPDAKEARQATNDSAEEPNRVPLPEPRPKTAGTISGPTPPSPDLVEAEVPLDPIPDPLCDELEASGQADFERLPRIIDGKCGALTPIRLKALRPPNEEHVTFEPPVTVTCQIAKTALDWLSASVQPAAKKHLGGPITAFRQTGGYECRGRNRDPNGKLSEHGMANALDIGAFQRKSGEVVPVNHAGEAELGFLTDIRNAACGPFTTVLGPGVAAHEEHFHLDLARRGKNGRTTYCR
jgi:hypothetical protein